LERDGFRCHICKRECKKSGKHSDVRVATVDHHPVPLSRGGDHDWHNVRCACMGCNSRKKANWNGQRLLSFGASTQAG
jgi:5-methylcytosine-specific restriction endonuclease McrA